MTVNSKFSSGFESQSSFEDQHEEFLVLNKLLFQKNPKQRLNTVYLILIPKISSMSKFSNTSILAPKFDSDSIF